MASPGKWAGPLLFLFASASLAACTEAADRPGGWSTGSFPSMDGVPIAYQIRGDGPVSIVFVHGWLCDRGYWREQVDHFAAAHTVVAIDLAGHGESGAGRVSWTMGAFGDDVAAVVNGLGLEEVVLVGHSMGAAVIVEAARRLPDQVVGMVVADGFGDLDASLTPGQVEAALAPFRDDFPARVREIVSGSMFVPESDPILVDWIVDDMASSPPAVGIGAAEHFFRWFGRNSAEAFRELRAPIRAINSDMSPTNLEAAEGHGITVVLMSGVGHFVMLEDPGTFNAHLAEAIADFSGSES